MSTVVVGTAVVVGAAVVVGSGSTQRAIPLPVQSRDLIRKTRMTKLRVDFKHDATRLISRLAFNI